MVTCWGVAEDGSTVEIDHHRAARTGVSERWPPLGLIRSEVPIRRPDLRIVVGSSGPGGEPTVTVDGAPTGGGWERVESELALFAAERLSGLVAIHAAAVIRGAGALLVPGASGVGKSSLCVAAADAGARVLTDEYALVDPVSGLVTGWRRPVRVRRADGGIDRLALTVASGPVPIGLVAIVAYDPHARMSWAPISGAEAVMALIANTVCARSRPDEALEAALAISHSAPAVAGTRGEAADAVVALLALLDEHQAGSTAR